MTTAPRSALDAVNEARPIVARLGTTGDKEDVAADIIDAWTSVETGLRAQLGGSSMGGQGLIRELRQRQFLTLEQANALAEFHAARDRAGSTDYVPTDADISAVRNAFLKLEAGLLGNDMQKSVPVTPVMESITAAEPAVVPAPSRKRGMGLLIAVGTVVALMAALVLYFVVIRKDTSAYDEGVIAFKENRVEAAEGLFRKASTDDAGDPMPHVYLSRIERNRGNLGNANAEAVKAVQLGPASATALRELASVLFAQQNYESARKFYIRAIEADATDRTSQGFLGCSLVRLGRVDEGMKWIQRAGSGLWTSCAPPPGAPAGNPAVPMTVPKP